MRVGALYAILRLETNQFDAALGKAQGKMSAFMGVARVAAWAGVQAFAVITGASLFAAQSFEKHMQESLAIMGPISDEMRSKMETAAREVAKTSTFSANQAADAYYYLASAGFTAEQSISALPAVTMFAQAGVMDLEKATSYLLDTTTTMGLRSNDAAQNMENMTRVSDVLSAAAIESNASLEEMAVSLMNKSGPALRVLGKDIEEGAAVLMVMANAGVKGKVAGTNLGIVLRELQTKAIKNKDAFAEAGVAVFDASGEMRNMGDIVNDLEDHLHGLTDEQKKQALLDLGFTDRSVGVVQSLLGTSDAIKKYEKQLREAGGTTEDVATKQLDTFNAQAQIMWHKIVDVGISIGQKLLPGAKDMVVAIGNWIDENHELIATIVLGLVDAVGQIIGKIGEFIGIVAGVIRALEPVWFWIGEIVFVLGHLDAYVGKEGPFGVLADILMPIVTTFEEIVFWVQAVIRNFGDLEGFAGDESPLGFIGTLVQTMSDAFAWFVENVIPRVIEGFQILVNEVIPAVISGIQWVAEQAVPVLIAIFNMLIDEVLPRLIDGFNWVVENILPAIGAAILWVAEEVVPVLAAVFQHIADWVVDNMPLIQTIIGQALGAVSTAFQVAWAIIKWVWDTFGQHIWKGATMFGSVAIPVITGAISFLLETFKFVFDAIGKIWQAFADAGDTVVRAVKGVFRGLGRFFSGVWDDIGGAFRTGLNFVVDMLNGFIRFLNNFKISIPEIDLGPIGKYGGGSIDPFNFGMIPRFASGVRGFGGGLAVVGETGPELAFLPAGSNVYSNAESMAMLNGEMTVTLKDPDGAVARGGYSKHDIERAISDAVSELVGGARHRSLRVGSN